jgi:hypothetical protein
MASNNHIEGLEELTRQLENLGKNFPKPKIRKAVNAGMRIPLKKAKELAPKESGGLKKGLIKIEEPKFKAMKKKKKVVMRLVFDRGMNSIFQKPITPEGKGTRGGKKDTAYYPVSVEYGFKVNKDGTKEEGKYFVRDAIEMTSTATQEKVIESLLQSIDDITR